MDSERRVSCVGMGRVQLDWKGWQGILWGETQPIKSERC